MNTTEPISPTAHGRQTRGDMLADIVPVIDTVYVAGHRVAPAVSSPARRLASVQTQRAAA